MTTLTLESDPRVLVLESDRIVAQNLSFELKESGYEPIVAHDIDSGRYLLGQMQPAIIVVDRMLNTESGLTFCQRLRREGFCLPILILMSRDNLEDRVACLESGADDYLLKPYRLEDLLQRLKLFLQTTDVPEHEQLRFNELVLDVATRRAFRNGRTIELTMKEFELLKFLMEHPRDILTREQILENVWGYEFVGESNVIEVYIRYLRLKIETEGEKRLIQTVRGVGYVLRES